MIILQNTIKLHDSYFLTTFINQIQILNKNISNKKIPNIYKLLTKKKNKYNNTKQKSPQ